MIFAAVTAKLLDPAIIIAAIAGGALVPNWGYVLFVGVVAAIFDELILSSVGMAYRFDLTFVVIAFLAGTFWAALTFVVAESQRERRKRKDLTR